MFITYVHPVDGLPRARKCQSFKEAGMVIAALKTMGVNPEVEDDDSMIDGKTTALPLLVNPWHGAAVQNPRTHIPSYSDITI